MKTAIFGIDSCRRTSSHYALWTFVYAFFLSLFYWINSWPNHIVFIYFGSYYIPVLKDYIGCH
ncbi:hypothetical protein HMPREF1322_0120 [Porphyromonas gingivalis W50]|nr:hypothetical protein PGA7_00006070 [Porphyromonas gingivalis]EIW93526.1 hypothetical protein HMPREF1322_0120 [Porphyromonas gingivalis W50]